MAWLSKIGAVVSTPLLHSPDYDLVAEVDGDLLRVQVKTSGHRRGHRFSLQLSTRGGNRSWTGSVKHLDRSRCDFLFALVADGRRWFIPVAALEARTAITLGGTKYSEFEIDPIGAPAFAFSGAVESAPAARGSADVGESGGPVKSVLNAEWVRIPPPPSSNGAATGNRTRRQHARGRAGQALLRPKRQMTLPLQPCEEAGLAMGDRVRAHATGDGRLVLERIDGGERASLLSETERISGSDRAG